MNKTSIEWTHRPGTVGMTWNPIHAHIRGDQKTGNFCTKISPGCANCYAEKINIRWGNGLAYTVPNQPTAEFYLDDKELFAPLKRSKPSTIFAGDMFDLFHESIPTRFIAAVFAVMHIAQWHTFQLLTKRMDHAQSLLSLSTMKGKIFKELYEAELFKLINPIYWKEPTLTLSQSPLWPLKNVWLGTSIENQMYADERIPSLVETPAVIRFLSVEPQLSGIKLPPSTEIHWVICGGESGPGARMFRREWAEQLLSQCKAAGIPFFMKQMGSYAVLDSRYDQTISGATRKLRSYKGSDSSEWPENLRVREWPA